MMKIPQTKYINVHIHGTITGAVLYYDKERKRKVKIAPNRTSWDCMTKWVKKHPRYKIVGTFPMEFREW